jgi:large subunit ribosomal protein L21
MYAVLQTGGKQYRVQEGQVLIVEKLEQDVDSTVDFDKVLMVGEGDNTQIGQPYLAGAKVTAKVLEQGRHKKIKIIKFKRRKHQDKQMGHRQYYTAVRIEKISA